MTNQLIINKSKHHNIIQPLLIGIFGLSLFIIAYLGLVDNYNLTIAKLIPLGPLKLWFFGISLLSLVVTFGSIYSYFKSNIGLVLNTESLIYNDINIPISGIKSITSSINQNKQPIVIVEFYKSYTSDPNDKSMYRINIEIAELDFKKTDSLAQKIKDYIIANNIPNNIEYN